MDNAYEVIGIRGCGHITGATRAERVTFWAALAAAMRAFAESGGSKGDFSSEIMQYKDK